MKTQAEVLEGSSIPLDETTLDPEQLSLKELGILELAERYTHEEWQRVCAIIGIDPTAQVVSVIYEPASEIQGRWKLPYPTPDQL